MFSLFYYLLCDLLFGCWQIVILFVDMQCVWVELGCDLYVDLQVVGYFYECVQNQVIFNQQCLFRVMCVVDENVLYIVIESFIVDGCDCLLDYKLLEMYLFKGSLDVRVIDVLELIVNEIVLLKIFFGVFNFIVIDYVLCNFGICYLIVCGVVIDQCVDMVVCDVVDCGYLVILVEDVCVIYILECYQVCLEVIKGYCWISDIEIVL